MRMLILNYKRMKNDFLKFSSRKLFFSVMLAAALLAGSSQSAFAGTAGVQSVMQYEFVWNEKTSHQVIMAITIVTYV